jgi:hypothetical protein
MIELHDAGAVVAAQLGTALGERAVLESAALPAGARRPVPESPGRSVAKRPERLAARAAGRLDALEPDTPRRAERRQRRPEIAQVVVVELTIRSTPSATKLASRAVLGIDEVVARLGVHVQVGARDALPARSRAAAGRARRGPRRPPASSISALATPYSNPRVAVSR